MNIILLYDQKVFFVVRVGSLNRSLDLLITRNNFFEHSLVKYTFKSIKVSALWYTYTKYTYLGKYLKYLNTYFNTQYEKYSSTKYTDTYFKHIIYRSFANRYFVLPLKFKSILNRVCST